MIEHAELYARAVNFAPTPSKAHVGDWRAGNVVYAMRGVRETRKGAGSAVPTEVFVPDLLPTCSFCGSLRPSDAVAVMETRGAEFSGSDWKYGWPHKFYLDAPCDPYESVLMTRSEGGTIVEQTLSMRERRHHKFYSVHMLDASPEDFERWEAVAAPLLGVHFERLPESFKWSAPCRGWQIHGVVA